MSMNMTTVMKYSGEYRMSIKQNWKSLGHTHTHAHTCTINYRKCAEVMNNHWQFYIFKIQQNAIKQITKHFILDAKSYMFQHQGAIIRKYINKKRYVLRSITFSITPLSICKHKHNWTLTTLQDEIPWDHIMTWIFVCTAQEEQTPVTV
jgi:hypothetical protein